MPKRTRKFKKARALIKNQFALTRALENRLATYKVKHEYSGLELQHAIDNLMIVRTELNDILLFVERAEQTENEY